VISFLTNGVKPQHAGSKANVYRWDTQDGTPALKLDKKTAFGCDSATPAPTSQLHYLFLSHSFGGQERSSL